MSHKTKFIKFGDNQAYVDANIADLVLNLWKLDLLTCNSCQDNPKGFVWIEFTSAYTAEEFLNLVAQYNDDDRDSIYQRILHDCDEWNKQTETWGGLPTDWKYDIHLDDFGRDPVIDDKNEHLSYTFTGKHMFNFSVSVRFPHRDVPFVKAQIKKAVAQKGAAKN
jgi:hypothetical protein